MALAPLSIEQFKNQFYREKCPWWFAYDVGAKKVLRGRYKDHDETASEEEVLDWSWIQFEELVGNIAYGRLEVVCKSSENAQKGNAPTFTVEWGDPALSAGASPVGRRASHTQPAVGGSWPMMQYFLQQQDKTRDELHQAQMEALQLRFENRMLAQQVEDDNAPTMKEDLIREGIGALKTILTANTTKPAAQLGTLGQRNEEAESAALDRGGDQRRTLTPDDALRYMTAITGLFPDWDPYTVLDALYNLGRQNQAILQAQLQNIIIHAQKQA